MTIKNLIFDWSGTISNDLQPVFEGTVKVFEHFGMGSITIEDFRRKFILPYIDFYRMYDPDFVKEEGDRIFRKVFPTLTPPTIYAGARAVIEQLKSDGYRLLIMSSHFSAALEKEVEEYGLAPCFSEINGEIPDKTEALSGIVERNGFIPPETMYIGDMVHDIRAGQSAGVISVALCWGYQDRERLSAAGPDYILETLLDLPVLLQQINTQE